MTLRVVNLGLPKTGTTTLARALRRSGFRVADHRISPRQTDDPALKNQYVADLLYRGYFETGDPGAHLIPFGAITEMSMLGDDRSIWPQTDFGLIEAIRAHHPGVKFVASNRDSWAISQSILAWSNLGTDRLPGASIPGLPEGYGETSKQRMQWIEAHYAHLRAIFAQSDDFFEYDVAAPDTRMKLAAFIGQPIVWWGRANVNHAHKNTRSEVT